MRGKLKFMVGELGENVIQDQDDSLGNLTSRWHANRTGNWLVKW